MTVICRLPVRLVVRYIITYKWHICILIFYIEVICVCFDPEIFFIYITLYSLCRASESNSVTLLSLFSLLRCHIYAFLSVPFYFPYNIIFVSPLTAPEQLRYFSRLLGFIPNT